ncbi:MAG: sensor histidine kinase [bacterium]
MSLLRSQIKAFDAFSIKNLGLRHKTQIIFGLVSLVPLTIFAYILLTENVLLGTHKWLLVSLSVLLALFGLELLYATVEEVNERAKMNRRLIQAERLASVGRLAGGVAHETLNPINIISGRVQLLSMEKRLDPRILKTLGIINDQTKRVAAIVNNLRQFSKKSKGGKAVLDIHELLHRTISLVEYEMRVNNIEIIRRFDSRMIHILGANDELGQGFLNIVVNAADAMPQGGTLTVSTRLIDHHTKPVIEIRFSDTGCGVPDEAVDRLFDPFFRADEEKNRSGLGLFVSFGIMKDHGGTIWVDNSADKGLTFVVELPVVQQSCSHKTSQNSTNGFNSLFSRRNSHI